MAAANSSSSASNQFLFWGCFISLITTAFAFITRTFMVNTPSMWPADFGLDEVKKQTLFGHGIWPFAVSIIIFSLIIDRIGYRIAMYFSVICYILYAVFALLAYQTVHDSGLDRTNAEALKSAQDQGYLLLTIGSIILGLGNGTVEAFINPVVATVFKHAKTQWLNILHAGWPGGLVLGGLITIGLGEQATTDWRNLIYIIAIPAVVYLAMLSFARFPVSERVAGGATYREMLAEFGVLGAALAAFLIFKQIGMTFKIDDGIVYIATVIAVVAYGAYCQSLGRPLMIFLCLIMMPLATTELGTDGAITGIMEEPMKKTGLDNSLWVLIYTSAIMMVLRFFSGPVVKFLTPLGLLATCAGLAVVGLYGLSLAEQSWMILVAATIYGIGKTYFWPTMLGVVSEQFPKGGALTLNAIAGIGMLTVGIVGGPLIGHFQELTSESSLQEKKPGIYEKISTSDKYFLGSYDKVDPKKVETLDKTEAKEVTEIVNKAKQSALAKVTVFPAIMLLCYIILILYFKARGGYKPVEFGGGSSLH